MKNQSKAIQSLLRVEELEERIAPDGNMINTNPAHNTPPSESSTNGQAVDDANPAGNFPPGQNKEDI
jgi:hypothetical protein